MLIALTLGLSTDLVLTNLVATARPTSSSRSGRTTTTPVKKPGQTQPGSTSKRRSILNFRVSNIRASRNREAGASRGRCIPQDITALLPAQAKSSTEKIPVELTINHHPTFFINVPENTATSAEFLLSAEDKTPLLREDIDLTAKNAGIIGYTLPKSFKGLETGKKYRWRFTLLCDPEDRSGNPRTSGWVEKIEPTATVAKQLKAATTLDERAAIYASTGYWQDTLKALTDLRTANPNDQDIVASWNNVLSSVGLKSLAQKPVFEVTGKPSEGL
ncbi:MAG TPA: DUF928 domain-containing protein [Nostocaceae cyanobacterium]|nr:DUF928 domain-containing protein [Nostocaceae cyanobacterium]